MEEVPRRTSLVPLASPCLLLCLIGVEAEELLDYQGRAGDHFHCTVEPSPGHIRCRNEAALSRVALLETAITLAAESSKVESR